MSAETELEELRKKVTALEEQAEELEGQLSNSRWEIDSLESDLADIHNTGTEADNRIHNAPVGNVIAEGRNTITVQVADYELGTVGTGSELRLVRV